ncbi:hypothetical protein HRQ65_05605 [Tatlockia micdadei]|uniref:hypothetical protein n=1 Tax=Legionella micdadei TaxID=451 RepID=UPI00156D5F23|nr:hypothetical protein [Legionella micdadei]NSL17860.1 hypothetical protein [Legionella micdadei]
MLILIVYNKSHNDEQIEFRMTIYRKLFGNYVEVMKQLGIPKALFDLLSSEKQYRKQALLDLHRTCYLSYSLTAEQIKDKLLHPINNSNYTQGDWDGAIFVDPILSAIRANSFATRLVTEEHKESLKEFDKQNLRMCYLDDQGQLCALSFGYIRDDSNAEIPESKRKHWLTAAIIKNVNHPFGEREVTFLGDTELLDDPAISASGHIVRKRMPERESSINEKGLLAEIQKATNSADLNQLIASVFQPDGTFSPLGFRELAGRLHENHNIDNRDERKTRLIKYIEFARSLPANEALEATLKEIEGSVDTDLNFFTNSRFEQVLKKLSEAITTSLQANEDMNNNVRERFQVANNLIFLATNLQTYTDFTNNSENTADYSVYIQFTKTEKKLRELISATLSSSENPPEDATLYANKSLETLVKEENSKAEKIKKFLELLQSYKPQTNNNSAFKEFVERQRTRHTDPDFYDQNEKFMARLKIELEAFLGNQKAQQPRLFDQLDSHIQQLERYINDTKALNPDYLQKLLSSRLNDLKAIQKNPSADDVDKYIDKTFEEFRDLFLDEIFSNDKTLFRKGIDYLLPPSSEEEGFDSIELSEPSQKSGAKVLLSKESEEFQNKILQRAEALVKHNNERIDKFYRRLAKLDELLDKTEGISPIFKDKLKSKITDFLGKKDSSPIPSADYLRCGNFRQLVETLAHDAHHLEKQIIYKETAQLIELCNIPAQEPHAPEDKGFFVRNRNTLISVGILSAIAGGCIASGFLAPVGFAIALGLFIAGGVSGIAVLVGLIKTAYDESKFIDVIEDYESEAKEYDRITQQIEDLNRAADKRIVNLENDFDHSVELILENKEEISELFVRLGESLENAEMHTQEGLNHPVKPIVLPPESSGKSPRKPVPEIDAPGDEEANILGTKQ